MIPKIIHYCWFGEKPLPPFILSCISTWRSKLPEYEIIEWNEKNFDINKVRFVKEAYSNKKFAFVSDFVRLYALYNLGGIYLDTDVTVLKKFDPLLNSRCFVGFEDQEIIATCVIGVEKNHPLVKEFMEYYHTQSFDKRDMPPNVIHFSKLLKDRGLNFNNHYQKINDDIEIYPSDYFSAKSFKTGLIKKTTNTYSIHHFAGSWLPK